MYSEASTTPIVLNHQVTVSGYSLHGDLGPHWIVRNNYGLSWGEDGWFRIAMPYTNVGIYFLATVRRMPTANAEGPGRIGG